MLMGVIFALIMFWISKLSYWRVHAQRCDLRLLVFPRHPPHYNAFFKELNGEDESDVAAKEASESLMQAVPQITLWRVLKFLANGGVRLRMMGSHLTGSTLEGRNKKEDASVVVSGAVAPSLPTAPTNSRVLPLPQPSVAVGGTTYSRTFSANLGGQRCVWTRHPPLARRVLHTHFRIFPITNAALAVQRLLSNEAVAGGHVDAPLDTAAFPLASRELYYDHASWLGDAAPGVLPDVPLLFLTTTAFQRQQAKARNSSGVSIADDAETVAARELFLSGVVKAHRTAVKEPASCSSEAAQFASAFALCSQELLFGDSALTNAAVASRLAALIGARLGRQQPSVDGALFDAGCAIAPAVNMPELGSTSNATYWGDVAPLGAAFVLGFNLSIPASLNAVARKVSPRHAAAVTARGTAAFLFDLAVAAAVVDVLASRTAQHKAGAKNLPSLAFRGLQAALDATFKRPLAASGFRLDEEPGRKAFYAPFVDPAQPGADVPASSAALLGLKLALLEATARAGGLEALVAQKRRDGLAAAAAAATAQGIPEDDTAARVACTVSLLDACWDEPMRAVLRSKCLSVLLHTARATATHAQLVLTLVGAAPGTTGAAGAALKGATNLRAALLQGFSTGAAPTATAIRQSRAVARCALRETLRLRPPVDICARMAETDDPLRATEMLDCKVGPESVPKRVHSTTGKATNGERDSNEEAYHKDSWKTGDQSVDMAAASGIATLPSSAVIVVDVGGMQRDASAFGAGDEFEWRRWIGQEKDVTSEASGRVDPEFYAPFGFGASAEAALALALEAGSSMVVAAVSSASQ